MLANYEFAVFPLLIHLEIAGPSLTLAKREQRVQFYQQPG